MRRLAIGIGRRCARAAATIILALAACSTGQTAMAQRGNAIDTLAAQMNQASQAGRNSEGLALAQKLEGLVRRQQGTDNMNYAGVLHNQGMFLHNLGRYQEAVEKLKTALAIKLRNNDPASTLRSSNILVSALSMLGRRAEASTVAERALGIGTQAFGPDDARLSDTLTALGSLARDLENYTDAERYFGRALDNLQKFPNAAPFEVAAAMDNLGDVYGLEGRFDDGERMLKAGLKLLEQAYGANVQSAPNYDKIWNDLGNLYTDAGRLPEAEATLSRALAMVRAADGESHPNVAATMGNLATVLEHESRFTEAEDLYKRTLEVYEKTFGPNSPMTAIGLNNLANVYVAQNRTQEAADVQQRVLAIYEKVFGADSPDVGRSLSNLAQSYQELGRKDEALALYQRSLRIMERKFGEDNGAITRALGSLGRTLQDDGRFEEAARYLDRALNIDERVLGPQHPVLVTDLRSIAALDLKTGNYIDARQRLTRALAIAQAKLGASHQDTIATMINLAELDGRDNKWQDALDLLRRASAGMGGQAGANAAQFKRYSELDTSLVDALWHVADAHPDDKARSEAFAAAQRAHETKAGAALAQMAARFGAGNDAIATAVRRQQDLKGALESLEKRIATELGAADGKRNDTLLASLRTESTRVRKSLDDTSVQIAHDFPAFAELSSPAPLTVSQAQALLKPDEALVSFLSLNDKSYVFAVTREGSVWQQIPLGNKAIADRVSQLRLGLYDPASDAAPKPFDLDASFDLYTALFGPVESAIASKPKLLVVPTAALTSLPPHVLVTRKSDPSAAPDDRNRRAAWLLNEKAITVLPSVASLRALRVFAKTSRATRPFIGFGDPQLRRSPAESKRIARNVQPYQSYYKGTEVDIETLRTGLPLLPDTADELRAVAHDLGASDDDVKLGAAATVTAVRTTPLDQYRVIEFATHGLVAGEVGGLSEPALVLSLPDKPTAEDNGLLTASRIAKLSLDADWAVLSACNTAAGDKPGAEGLSGLARAFFYAGARSLLVSYWPVENDAAIKLTTGAFAALAKDPKIGRAEALRRSIRALIADPSSAHNAEPSAWAPFVLVGEGG